jgi:hypothetical protein
LIVMHVRSPPSFWLDSLAALFRVPLAIFFSVWIECSDCKLVCRFHAVTLTDRAKRSRAFDA